MPKLIIFDLDGTLVHPFTSDFEPGVRYWLKHRPRRGVKLAIATNQGGVGLRHWREVVRAEGGDIGDPNANGLTQESTEKRVGDVARELDAALYMAFAYQSKKEGHWSPTPEGAESDPRWSQSWRKPAAGMLLQAMSDADVLPAETLFVGDSIEDERAASAAGCAYQHPDVFFADYRPRIVITYSPARIISWLRGSTDGLNLEATQRRYEDMLRGVARIVGHSVEIETKKTHGTETIKLVRAESEPHTASIMQMVGGRIRNEWIDREWLEFDTPEQHIDALISGSHLQQLVIIETIIDGVYGRDARTRCKARFEEVDRLTSKYQFVLG